MPKYIDADAAAEFVKKLAKPGDADFPTWILSMLEVLEIRPAANVRENKQSKWRCVDASDNVTKACRLAPVATRITVEGPVVIDPIARDTFRISLLTGRILVTDYRFGEIWAKAVEDNRQKREASGT